ncbi:membrane translocator [Streptomyces laurentii]|uniref:Membrane translocator n=1 Tax=Streptomyces laurentii TaxID=39478 RepID=A0A169PSS8_STRLU|nr:membrane translocator [Streptomyces laurentii]
MTNHASDADLEDLLRHALRATGTDTRWTTDANDMWCHVAPLSGTRREQGWKLHVSATAASAPAVLAHALGVLLREGSAFKFARSIEQVSALNSRATPRGNAGKFITVYPRSDAEAVRLAEELHQATTGLSGPRILSDQPYTPQSLVHYRYGSFVARRRLSDDGLLVWFIEDPDGNPVEDKRTGHYAPPAWAVSPFPVSAVPAPARGAKPADGPVVIGGRYAVWEAIRHTNKGGVYRGTCVRTGAPVVIKEARPHVEADASGSDVRDWLRAEARILERLKDTGLAPQPLGLFEHGGHLFLAEEQVPGIPLRNWVAERFRDVGGTAYRSDALDQAARLVELVAAAHAHGCVLRDFTPANIMVRPDGELRLIDLELAVMEDESPLPTRVGTPGFSPPERLVGAPVHATGDYYSLGACLCFVLAGKVPTLLPEEPDARAPERRLAEWLAACAGPLGLPEDLAETILGLMRDEPAERWAPARAREVLRKTVPGTSVSSVTSVPSVSPVPSVPPVASEPPARTHRGARSNRGAPAPEAPADDVDEAVAGVVAHLVDSMTPDDDRRLWPVSTSAGESGPCTVQQGAAGVLAVLTRYWELTGDPRLPDVLATAGRWIADRTDLRSPRPGLHFGGPGTAWALYDAGRALGDRRLTDHALALASAPLLSTPHHDITHGTAGSGLAFLHLFQRTGEARFAELAVDAADRLAAAARRDASAVSWPVPAEADEPDGGSRYLGFAHGTAGIGCFLLAASAVSGSREHREPAVQAGEYLLASALVVGGAAQWPARAGDVPTAPYWCHGSAGIGMFLVRLWEATGDDRFGEAARYGTYAVTERASRAALTQCHGLAGNGDFLLDVADAMGDPATRARAGELARLLVREGARRGGHLVFPNEYGDVSTSWSDGSAGILGFLLRIRHTSPRHWMVRLPG